MPLPVVAVVLPASLVAAPLVDADVPPVSVVLEAPVVVVAPLVVVDLAAAGAECRVGGVTLLRAAVVSPEGAGHRGAFERSNTALICWPPQPPALSRRRG